MSMGVGVRLIVVMAMVMRVIMVMRVVMIVPVRVAILMFHAACSP